MEKWHPAKHPECKFKPKEYFQAELDELFGKDEYTLLEPYYGSSSEVKIRHNKCNHITYTKGTRHDNIEMIANHLEFDSESLPSIEYCPNTFQDIGECSSIAISLLETTL